MNEESLKIKEAADKARVSVTTVWRWTQYGYRGYKLAYERAGKGIRLNSNTFDEFLRKTKAA